ncbi:RsiV family protein [Polluticoccus soli]|uniref:RsiV family protein n=1 Tax=Polluticoccus soli TaxID=3034150 RepID=UPI0023E2E62C|nr:RsiV family protein [Flavipsychrobacter sp. JY13-12]
MVRLLYFCSIKENYAFLLLFLVWGCISCNSSAKHGEQVQSTDNKQSTNTPVEERDWHKQYSGTVAGQPVHVQLQKYGDELHGSYYYIARGQVINLLPDPATHDSLVLSENPTTEMGGWENGGEWHSVIKGDSITGVWTDSKGKKMQPIRLKEVNPSGSIKLAIPWLKDSAKLSERRKDYTVFASYQFLVPAKNAAYDHKVFVDSVLHGPLGCKVGELERCMRSMADSFFLSYREDMDGLDTAEHVSSYDEQLRMWVLLNRDGWLVVECFGYDYTGGAHGIFGSSFLNIDLQRGKLWKLGDVIEGDTARLRPLLVEAARKYFKLKPQEKLGGVLLDLEEPTVTDNFYITPTGLTFVYNPYEITPYSAGMITLFVPYGRLYGLLTPEFSARMNKK